MAAPGLNVFSVQLREWHNTTVRIVTASGAVHIGVMRAFDSEGMVLELGSGILLLHVKCIESIELADVGAH